MTETVLSFFDNSWVPATWLTPSIQGISITGSALFSWVMTEVSWWRYSYEITNYNKGIKYLITVDWWATMWASRYQYVTNELDSYENKPDRKWQRAWSGQMSIDASLIAKEVWKVSAENPIKWTYGEVVQKEMKAIDFAPILKAINDIPKWVTIKDIKDIIPEYNNDDVIAWIKEINKYVLEVIKTQKDMYEDIEELEEVFEWHKSEIVEKMDEHKSEYIEKVQSKEVEVDNLKWMISDLEEYLSKYSESISDLDIAPNLLSQYTEIVKNLWDRKELDKKITYISLIMEDILSKLGR